MEKCHLDEFVTAAQRRGRPGLSPEKLRLIDNSALTNVAHCAAENVDVKVGFQFFNLLVFLGRFFDRVGINFLIGRSLTHRRLDKVSAANLTEGGVSYILRVIFKDVLHFVTQNFMEYYLIRKLKPLYFLSVFYVGLQVNR